MIVPGQEMHGILRVHPLADGFDYLLITWHVEKDHVVAVPSHGHCGWVIEVLKQSDYRQVSVVATFGIKVSHSTVLAKVLHDVIKNQ